MTPIIFVSTGSIHFWVYTHGLPATCDLHPGESRAHWIAGWLIKRFSGHWCFRCFRRFWFRQPPNPDSGNPRSPSFFRYQLTVHRHVRRDRNPSYTTIFISYIRPEARAQRREIKPRIIKDRGQVLHSSVDRATEICNRLDTDFQRIQQQRRVSGITKNHGTPRSPTPRLPRHEGIAKRNSPSEYWA
ncbi:hypothetical protein BZA05DRAFT_384820 [Tricharina praecox]|uniref:uncharacterized protein n=1 Tax=Tricharina praecox TaxID=43433 RepID=UPI00221F7961|nr:uncharacterized protein BZA05DRAFT_384820 [Tricharina praecox]KAI5857790.1 hypothetical protein BZA05DRAFT_384820 [Tricharina praecox]